MVGLRQARDFFDSKDSRADENIRAVRATKNRASFRWSQRRGALRCGERGWCSHALACALRWWADRV